MKKLMSAMLVVSMIASMSSGAFAATVAQPVSQAVDGKNEIKNPIYSYQIPLNLDFAIDAFEKGGASQVYSGAFPIINMSDVPLSVKVSANISQAKGGVTIKDSSAAVSKTAGDEAKEIYMELVAATEADATTTPGAAVDATGALEAPEVVTQPSNPVAFAQGDGNSTPTSITIDFTGIVASDPNASGGAAYTAIVKDADGKPVFFVNGVGVTGATPAAPTADEIAASFATKGGTALLGKKEATLTDSTYTSGASVVFQTADFNAVGDLAAASDWSVEVVPSRGTSATATLKTDTLKFPLYDNAAGTIKDGADTKAKIPVKAVSANAKDQLWFVLKNAVYDKNFKNEAEDTLLKSLQTDPKENVGSFRLMGTVTPSAPWVAEDITVTATFDVGGIPESKTSGLTALGAQNVKAIDPSVKAGAALSLGNISTTPYDLTFSYGSLMKSIKKVEIQPLGALATTWTNVAAAPATAVTATTAGYKIDEATGKISLMPGTQKLFKATKAANFNEATMTDKNKVRITFNDGTADKTVECELTVNA